MSAPRSTAGCAHIACARQAISTATISARSACSRTETLSNWPPPRCRISSKKPLAAPMPCWYGGAKGRCSWIAAPIWRRCPAWPAAGVDVAATAKPRQCRAGQSGQNAPPPLPRAPPPSEAPEWADVPSHCRTCRTGTTVRRMKSHAQMAKPTRRLRASVHAAAQNRRLQIRRVQFAMAVRAKPKSGRDEIPTRPNHMARRCRDMDPAVHRGLDAPKRAATNGRQALRQRPAGNRVDNPMASPAEASGWDKPYGKAAGQVRRQGLTANHRQACWKTCGKTWGEKPPATPPRRASAPANASARLGRRQHLPAGKSGKPANRRARGAAQCHAAPQKP